MGQKKYYAVWAGHCPGVYDSWSECLLQVKGYKGAVYKGFATKAEALEALAGDYRAYMGASARPAASARALPPEVVAGSIAVDAACSGNPGLMEYRGVHVPSGRELFHFGPVMATNNIGEFLAIVHALALVKENGWNVTIYSDSRTAMSWVREKKCKTSLRRSERTARAFELVARAERWLAANGCPAPVAKWETRRWGEIPADFGRK